MGQNIKFLRKLRGMSQRELAERIGLKRNNIASYEAGIVEPSAVTFIVLAKFFEVDPVDLLTRRLEPPAGGEHSLSEEPPTGPAGNDVVEPSLSEVRNVVEGLRQFYRSKNVQRQRTDGPNSVDQEIEYMLSALTNMLNQERD